MRSIFVLHESLSVLYYFMTPVIILDKKDNNI